MIDMKIEILFRGKRKDNGEWVYGWYCVMSGIDYIIPENEQFRNPADPDFENSFIEVYPETVGQFTGEHDAKGNSIFENDILKYVESTSNHNYFVVFKNGSFDLHHTQIIEAWRNGHLRWGSLQRAFELGDKFKLEVIGNIHDNPELLK